MKPADLLQDFIIKMKGEFGLTEDDVIHLKKMAKELIRDHKKTELNPRGREGEPSLKPPKEWWEEQKKEIEHLNYTDQAVRRILGDMWYHKLSESERRQIREQYGKRYG